MYAIELSVQDDQIDFQNIVSNLYYPLYLQECRHRFLKEKAGIDVYEYAKKGLNLVIVEYKLKFIRSLKKEDRIMVTCEILLIPKSRTKIIFAQKIFANDKLCAEAEFVGTCLPVTGGRPYIPQEILNMGTK